MVQYCADAGLHEPTGSCAAGYYCPPGQNETAPAAFACEAGYRCPNGTALQLECSAGSYQTATGQVGRGRLQLQPAEAKARGCSCKRTGFWCAGELCRVPGRVLLPGPNGRLHGEPLPAGAP